MKKTLILSLVFFLTVGCAGNNSGAVDDIAVYYGVSSYAMFGADREFIEKLYASFTALEFAETDEELDLFSAFNVNFFSNGKFVKKFWVDKNGIFWIDGETQSYKIVSGEFDYSYLKQVYENSKNTKG